MNGLTARSRSASCYAAGPDRGRHERRGMLRRLRRAAREGGRAVRHSRPRAVDEPPRGGAARAGHWAWTRPRAAKSSPHRRRGGRRVDGTPPAPRSLGSAPHLQAIAWFSARASTSQAEGAGSNPVSRSRLLAPHRLPGDILLALAGRRARRRSGPSPRRPPGSTGCSDGAVDRQRRSAPYRPGHGTDRPSIDGGAHVVIRDGRDQVKEAVAIEVPWGDAITHLVRFCAPLRLSVAAVLQWSDGCRSIADLPAWPRRSPRAGQPGLRGG
jgi:hypothetical protein